MIVVGITHPNLKYHGLSTYVNLQPSFHNDGNFKDFRFLFFLEFFFFF